MRDIKKRNEIYPSLVPPLLVAQSHFPRNPADTVVDQGARADALEADTVLAEQPLKELRLPTFNARVGTVITKPFFGDPFQSMRSMIPVFRTNGRTRVAASSRGISRRVTSVPF